MVLLFILLLLLEMVTFSGGMLHSGAFPKASSV